MRRWCLCPMMTRLSSGCDAAFNTVGAAVAPHMFRISPNIGPFAIVYGSLVSLCYVKMTGCVCPLAFARRLSNFCTTVIQVSSGCVPRHAEFFTGLGGLKMWQSTYKVVFHVPRWLPRRRVRHIFGRTHCGFREITLRLIIFLIQMSVTWCCWTSFQVFRFCIGVHCLLPRPCCRRLRRCFCRLACLEFSSLMVALHLRRTSSRRSYKRAMSNTGVALCSMHSPTVLRNGQSALSNFCVQNVQRLSSCFRRSWKCRTRPVGRVRCHLPTFSWDGHSGRGLSLAHSRLHARGNVCIKLLWRLNVTLMSLVPAEAQKLSCCQARVHFCVISLVVRSLSQCWAMAMRRGRIRCSCPQATSQNVTVFFSFPCPGIRRSCHQRR